MARSLLALALLSGAAGLVYEVVWMRWFRLLFGSSAYAASATLCAFFAGLALGSALFGRVAGRTRRPLALYGWVELGAAAAALLVPLALRLYEPVYGSLYQGFGDSRGIFQLTKTHAQAGYHVRLLIDPERMMNEPSNLSGVVLLGSDAELI